MGVEIEDDVLDCMYVDLLEKSKKLEAIRTKVLIDFLDDAYEYA